MPFGRQGLGPVDVVAVVGVAAVDHDVTRAHALGQVLDGLAGEGGRHHHPGHLGRRRARRRTSSRVVAPVMASLLGGQRRHRVGAHVVDHAGVPVAHQAPHQVGPHATESDHSELHGILQVGDQLQATIRPTGRAVRPWWPIRKRRASHSAGFSGGPRLDPVHAGADGRIRMNPYQVLGLDPDRVPRPDRGHLPPAAARPPSRSAPAGRRRPSWPRPSGAPWS